MWQQKCYGGIMATILESEQTEKISLSSYAKKHVRYGSMAKESGIKNERYLKHIVQPGDTLQGLALRYGVTKFSRAGSDFIDLCPCLEISSICRPLLLAQNLKFIMEQIKRANKMWTTDSLFLRSTLDIPVDTEAFTVSSISSAPQSPESSPVKHRENGEDCTNTQTIDLSLHLNSDISENNSSNLAREESAADFLIRIDSHIAQTKDKVLKLQNKVVYSEDDLHNSRDGYSPHMSYQYQRNSLTGSSSLSNLTIDPSVTPQPVVMTKGRKIKSSLMKLEKEQDEIFEL